MLDGTASHDLRPMQMPQAMCPLYMESKGVEVEVMDGRLSCRRPKFHLFLFIIISSKFNQVI